MEREGGKAMRKLYRERKMQLRMVEMYERKESSLGIGGQGGLDE